MLANEPVVAPILGRFQDRPAELLDVLRVTLMGLLSRFNTLGFVYRRPVCSVAGVLRLPRAVFISSWVFAWEQVAEVLALLNRQPAAMRALLSVLDEQDVR